MICSSQVTKPLYTQDAQEVARRGPRAPKLSTLDEMPKVEWTQCMWYYILEALRAPQGPSNIVRGRGQGPEGAQRYLEWGFHRLPEYKAQTSHLAVWSECKQKPLTDVPGMGFEVMWNIIGSRSRRSQGALESRGARRRNPNKSWPSHYWT